MVHYVAPTIWAYRKSRLKTLERLYDFVLSILPFEAKYYKKSSVKYRYVGHPLLANFKHKIANNSFRNRYNIAKNNIILGIMAGSRNNEVNKFLPVFVDAVNQLLASMDSSMNFMIIFPATNSDISEKIRNYKKYMHFKSIVIDTSDITEHHRIEMLQSFDYALVKSGTSSLELTLARVPMVVAYKISIISEIVAKYILGGRKLKYVSITNILLDEFVIQEFLQKKCNARDIAHGLAKLFHQDYRKKQLLKYAKVASMLENKDGEDPSCVAARHVLDLIH